MKTYNIAAIPGDGIGTEVIAAGVEVLELLAKHPRLGRQGHDRPSYPGTLQSYRNTANTRLNMTIGAAKVLQRR